SIPTDPNGVLKWPKPEDVHLVEWIGAFNTFVLILSSLTVVLAHYAAGKGKYGQATIYVGVTTLLGLVFLGVKAVEYKSKFDHDILPGHVGELKEGVGQARERQFHGVGLQYSERVRKQLEKINQETPDAKLLEEVADVVKSEAE